MPAGTGNLLARNLDIPLYLRSAVDVALNGQDRAIDMVEVSGDKMEDATFLVMAGMGFDAAIMEGVNEDIKAKVGWLAYVWSALKSLMFPAIRVEVSVDGGDVHPPPRPHPGHRQRRLPAGRDAADPGRGDRRRQARRGAALPAPVPVLAAAGRAGADQEQADRRDDHPDDRHARSSYARHVDAPRQLDGDLIPPGRELRARCVHGRLLVRVPR